MHKTYMYKFRMTRGWLYDTTLILGELLILMITQIRAPTTAGIHDPVLQRPLFLWHTSGQFRSCDLPIDESDVRHRGSGGLGDNHWATIKEKICWDHLSNNRRLNYSSIVSRVVDKKLKCSGLISSKNGCMLRILNLNIDSDLVHIYQKMITVVKPWFCRDQ